MPGDAHEIQLELIGKVRDVQHAVVQQHLRVGLPLQAQASVRANVLMDARNLPRILITVCHDLTARAVRLSRKGRTGVSDLLNRLPERSCLRSEPVLPFVEHTLKFASRNPPRRFIGHEFL
jgi:hypothetical protein